MRHEIDIKIDTKGLTGLTPAVGYQIAQLFCNALLIGTENGIRLFVESFNVTGEWEILDFVKVFNTRENPYVLYITATKVHSQFA